MTLPDISALLIPVDATIRRALETINQNAQGLVFVVDHDSKLVGIATDGDIRRALLANHSLEESVREIMSSKVLSCPIDTPAETTAALLSERIRHIPLVDSEGRPKDYACLHRLHRTPIAEPHLGGNELAYVTECIKTNWISSQGRFIRSFEKQFVDYCGAPYALAVSNGTVALHLALAAFGIKEGDEVIVPDLTFAACANAVLYTGAKPVLVDVDPRTWTLDIEKTIAAITPKTRAIMPVHLYGHPCDMDRLMPLAKNAGLLVIEDCAEALGATCHGKRVGSFGDAATFSFFGNKTVTTGEGGMILFRDQAFHQRAGILRDHGMSKEKRYWHPEVGFNYRMTNLQAAVGVAQMERVDELVSAKQRIAALYNELLGGVESIELPPCESWATNSYWLYTIRLRERLAPERNALIQKLLLNGIETRPAFYPLHEMPPYASCRGARSLENSKAISASGISLPSSVGLNPQEQRRIGKVLLSLIQTQSLHSGL